jgi:phosphomannomutase
MNDSIKFGTDGWRAIIAKDFTTDNVARVSEGVALWLLKNFENPSVVIGHDCRFGGSLFVNTAVSVLLRNGISVMRSDGFVSTPMISAGTKKYGASLGIILTASHNPYDYNGYKLKGHFGGPLLPDDISAIEALIPHQVPSYSTNNPNPEVVKILPLEDDYIKLVEDTFDIHAIKNCNLTFAYDAMYGAGQKVMKRLFPDITHLHSEHNPLFNGTAPEPILRNLTEFSHLIKSKGTINCGLATDGDADRIGLFDSKGNFVDSHHIILLLIHYLVKYKGFSGKVVTAFSVSDKVKKLCTYYNLDQETVKIGFKYVAGYFLNEDILLGGEESGGIAVKGHIPERDGIWMGLIIWEFMAKSGKTLEVLIEEVYSITGPFSYERADLHLTNDKKDAVMQKCSENLFKSFGGREITRLETIDGFKYHFKNEEWLMIRASGTEPVLRVYAEASGPEDVKDFLSKSLEDILA